MKQILIAPHFIQNKKIKQLVTSTYLSDYFLEKGFLPIMPVFHTNFKTKTEAFTIASEYIKHADAIVFQGGQHLEKIASRDNFEKTLLKLAISKNIPILGICRGFQLINKYFGGSIKNLENPKQHFSLKDKNENGEINFNSVNLHLNHQIELAKTGILSSFISQPKLTVNSAHQQGIFKLGKGLIIEAKSDDGLIEAFSNKNKKILALQWHPELNLKKSSNQTIFNHWLKWV